MDHDNYPHTENLQHADYEEHVLSRKNHSKLLIPLVILVVGMIIVGGLTYAWFATGGTVTTASCEYNGATYKVGEAVPSADGCNTCSCTYDEQSKSAQVACTAMACGEDVIDPTANWQEYRNDQHGFSFKYPEDYEVTKETSESVELGFAFLGSGEPVTYLTIFFGKRTDLDSLSLCSESQKTSPCISETGWSQPTPIYSSDVNGLVMMNAYVDYGVDSDFHIVQMQDAPYIEFNMNVSGGGLDNTFDQILSTFQFYDEEGTINNGRTSSIQLNIEGAEILLTNKQGQRVGFDVTSSKNIMEINNSTYGDFEIVPPGAEKNLILERELFISENADNEYTLEVIGTDQSSDFTISANGMSGIFESSSATISGTVSPGGILTYNLIYDSLSDVLTIK